MSKAKSAKTIAAPADHALYATKDDVSKAVAAALAGAAGGAPVDMSAFVTRTDLNNALAEFAANLYKSLAPIRDKLTDLEGAGPLPAEVLGFLEPLAALDYKLQDCHAISLARALSDILRTRGQGVDLDAPIQGE